MTTSRNKKYILLLAPGYNRFIQCTPDLYAQTHTHTHSKHRRTLKLTHLLAGQKQKIQ